MSVPDYPRFRAFVASQVDRGNWDLEVLRHELGAVINRNRLTGADEGISSLSTDQLAWLVLSIPDLPNHHSLLSGLALSAAVEGRWPLWREMRACGMIFDGWQWVEWAETFAGNEDDLLGYLAGFSDSRLICAAASLATESSPRAVGSRVLELFLREDTARVYHHLLGLALRGLDAPAIAQAALAQLAKNPQVLFTADVDTTLAELVRRCAGDPEAQLKPLTQAMGELTTVALAERLLNAGKPERALALCENLRLLSPAYPQAMIIASLAALEAKRLKRAAALVERIEDATTRLKVRCRIAQATADIDTELNTLVELHELVPNDGDAFQQLVEVVERLSQHELSRHLCLQAQERFHDQPEMLAFIRRRTV